jgi:hypothetical protein
MRNYGMKLTPSELKVLMVYFDKDGDGTIDYNEFLVGMRGHMPPRRRMLITEGGLDTLGIRGRGRGRVRVWCVLRVCGESRVGGARGAGAGRVGRGRGARSNGVGRRGRGRGVCDVLRGCSSGERVWQRKGSAMYVGVWHGWRRGCSRVR